MNDLTGGLEIMLGLLALVAALALLARKLKLPYTIGVVIAGLALGWIPGLPMVGLPPQLFLKFLLPLLLYPAAFFMPWREFRTNLRPISMLALGLVVFTMLGVGFTAHWLVPDLPLAAAFVLGAIVSPTDPLAATAIARRMNVPDRIQRVIEGEGLVNDSTGLVSYRIAVAAVVTGSFSWEGTLLEFVKMAGGGIGFGLAVGWLLTQIQKRIDDPSIEITISLLTPFAAYLPAEQLGLSGVLAVVSAGLFLGWRSPLIHNAQMRLQAVPVWETIQFMFNGLVFLLIGLELPQIIRQIKGTPALVLAGEAIGLSAAVVIIRVLWVFASVYLPRFVSPKLRSAFPNWRHVALVAWTGMRGAVSLAAALGLPHTIQNGKPFPGRYQILFLTYSVILATLVVQGLTLPTVIRWLALRGGGETGREEREARIRANEAVLAHLESVGSEVPEEARARLRKQYEDRVRQLKEEADSQDEKPHPAHDYHQLVRDVLEIERRTVIGLRNEHAINDEALRRIQHDLDLAESQLKSGNRSGPRV